MSMERKKICHITSAHARYDTRVFENECVSLANAGYDVFLVVNDDLPDELIKGVHIVSTGKNVKRRIDRMLNGVNSVLEKSVEIDADVYHLHDPELLRISKVLLKLKKFVIFDAHEDTELQILDKEWIPLFLRKPIAKIYGFYSANILRKLSGVITVTPNFVKKYKKINSNTIFVTNYPIVAEDYKRNIIEKQYLDDKQEKYVFFAGGLSQQWCHETVVEAVEKCNGIKYYFAGWGTDEYVSSISKSGATKYLGEIDHDKVMSYYSGSLAGMALLDCKQVGKDGTLGNTKLFEVMLAGKPIVCSDLRLWRQIIEEYDCGICVDPTDMMEIADAIKYIDEHPDIARTMGENGRRAVLEKYNWGTQEKVLLKFYSEMLTMDESENLM